MKSFTLDIVISNTFDDTDYEDMDDLALPDHIEWNNAQAEEFSLDAMDTVYGYYH